MSPGDTGSPDDEVDVVLGVDSSTQSTKVVARRLTDGAVAAVGRSPHPATVPPVSEQDPRAWWSALEQACAELGPVADRVVAMAVAGQQHGLVLLDDAGEPVRPAPLWNDTTAAPAAEALVDRLGADAWADGCGTVPVASLTVAKLAQVLADDPGSAERATRVMLPHDYLTWRLTDRHVTDRGDASGTGWFDPAEDRYRLDLLAAAVDDATGWAERLPAVLGPTEAAGGLSARAAEALGLAAGIPVGAGTGDNMGAALGLGLAPGDVALSLGTSGTVFSVSSAPTADPSGTVAGFADAGGSFLPLVCTLNATKVTDAMAAWLGVDEAQLAQMALAHGAAAGEVVMVPHLDGERTPNRPDASGTLVGLRTDTTREELARAAHDGVLCGLLTGLDALRAAGVDADGELLLVGGGARSPAYGQRCADLHQAAVRVPEVDEAVATGAAVQAAALVTGSSHRQTATAWGLDTGPVVEPRAPERGAEIRAAFASALAAAGTIA